MPSRLAGDVDDAEDASVAYGMDGMAPTPLRACRRACGVGAAGLEFGSPLSEESAQSYSDHSTRNESAAAESLHVALKASVSPWACV